MTKKFIIIYFQYKQQGSDNVTNNEAKKALIAVAVSNLGYRETGDNVTKFAAGTWDNTFYGWELQGQPWCDVYADYCYCQTFGNEKGAAMTYQRLGAGSALCSASAQYYKNNDAFFNYPETGDQAFFYYNGAINHTGIVETVNGSRENWNSFTCIEGNSSDMVARRTYYRGNSVIAGFGRPKWGLVTDGNINLPSTSTSSAVSTPIQTVTRFGNKGSQVKELQEKLIKLGYSCGKDGADGDFGLNTLNAVLKFQRDYSLEVDGVAGPLTISAINKALKEAGGNTTTTTTTQTNTSIPSTNIVFKKDDKVKIKEGATYYNTDVKIPDFVLNDIWIIYQINGNRAVINKNVNETRSIMSPIDTNNLIKA